jgi:hypothetical protein
MHEGTSEDDYLFRVKTLSATIRSFIYGTTDDRLEFFYYTNDDPTKEKIIIANKTIAGKLFV